MTGYGRGRAENKVAAAEVELRSVNGKGLSLKLRVPTDRLALEPALEGRIRKNLERGSVHGFVRIRLIEHSAAVIDQKVLGRYLKEWRRVEKALGIEVKDPTMAELLALPGAYESGSESTAVSRSVARVATEALDNALASLIGFREKEGKSLAKELNGLARKLEQQLKKVNLLAPKAVQASQERMVIRVKKAWAAAEVANPLDLTREIVTLADKAEVREEVARLEIHLGRLHKVIDAGGPCGRELEFLVQECHREITTLGNKSADPRMSEAVVGMKLHAGQLKEQIANVE